MKTASLFINGRSQAVRIPKEFEFEGVAEVEISREGDALILRPARKTWTSFADAPMADADFLADRGDVIEDGRVVL
ncbi:type II toxin-antitoxin system VapB family antitoxin [Alkalimonas delamerensis]|uniref:Type II toxin-antitoxin system VapB family antitoxin n=1 Tax=Alkalimonas delamerensis TaxID=265981 RepID=A0ABT9GSV6_9GAMM|nr:type II toxin-antitoxin system VapB family antitoxin [Alkalimonas delamerensis]MDP4530070.1 type II toxin-antitoxin system VapB family antitoxin [Alkalimonas delamerensis]